jgi:uracil phosphoribosyltransferase
MPYISKFDFDNFYNIFFKEEPNMSQQPIILNHPLIQHKLSILRREDTDTKMFRELVTEIAMLMCFEATRDLATEEVEIKTPVAPCKARQLKGKQPAIVPILRAGLGMVDGMQELLPQSRVGHIGLYRDPETSLPVEYYCKLPDDIAEREVFIVDPMLATGGSAIDAIGQIKKRGVANIRFMCIIAAPEGLKALNEAHPDVKIYCAALDDHLNEHNYIVPGLGDAGDRIFGTK